MSNLSKLYYDPQEPSSYGGIERLYRRAKIDDPSTKRSSVKKWLSAQIPYTVHRSVRHRFKRNRIYVDNKDDQWQADLADMQSLARHNQGYKYMLTVIDIFSKFAIVKPLKSKKPSEIIGAFDEIFKSGAKPVALQTDRGTEFKNQSFQLFLKKNDVKFFTSQNQTIKCAVVERFNRTIKSRIYRYFTAKGTSRWTDVIQQLVDSYNRSTHRSIKMRPIEVNDDNRHLVYNNLYDSMTRLRPRHGKAFNIGFGDNVRINKLVQPFRKGYLPSWSEETFKVVSANRGPEQTMFKVRDASGKFYEPRLYADEIQPVTENAQSTFRIEKILRTKIVDGSTYRLIKWLGFPSSFNTWEPARNVIDLRSLNS
jgi:transposase InsO family protein